MGKYYDISVKPVEYKPIGKIVHDGKTIDLYDDVCTCNQRLTHKTIRSLR